MVTNIQQWQLDPQLGMSVPLFHKMKTVYRDQLSDFIGTQYNSVEWDDCLAHINSASYPGGIHHCPDDTITILWNRKWQLMQLVYSEYHRLMGEQGHDSFLSDVYREKYEHAVDCLANITELIDDEDVRNWRQDVPAFISLELKRNSTVYDCVNICNSIINARSKWIQYISQLDYSRRLLTTQIFELTDIKSSDDVEINIRNMANTQHGY